jgi:3-methyladenine DNA glycosylase/8-oxoguanine DNA glycosylase
MWKKAEEFLTKDKFISPLIIKWGSCTIKSHLHKDYFEHLCGDIIGQQLSGKVADVIFDRFKKAVGVKVTPVSVLSTPELTLRDCGMSWGKVSLPQRLGPEINKRRT